MIFGLHVFSFQVLKQRLTQGFSALSYLFFLFVFSVRERNQSGQTAPASRGRSLAPAGWTGSLWGGGGGGPPLCSQCQVTAAFRQACLRGHFL